MEIKNIYGYSQQQSFGIKIPTKIAIEAASGRFLENAKVSYPRQCKLLEQLSGLETIKLYSGEVATGFINLSRHLRENYPPLNTAADNIIKLCDEINKDRSFLTKDEITICKQLKTALSEEIKKIGSKVIQINKISLNELGLEKYSK